MEINLKDTLRSLRQKKNVTQEALANHLGITPQSVGKWERGEGFPDITLLPRIALYFNVTIDELLDVDKARIDEKIEAYRKESAQYSRAGENGKNLALWKKAYDEFPNDCRVMEMLISAIEQAGDCPLSKEDAERVIALGKQLLQDTTDTQQREFALSSLSIAYRGIGDEENALHYANMGGSIYATRERMLANVQKGEDGVKACQQCLLSSLQLAAVDALIMLSKAEFSLEEEIAAYQFSIDLLERLFSDGNTGFFAHNLSDYYFNLSVRYARIGDVDKTIEALDRCAEYAVGTVDLRKMQYTAPMVNRLGYDPEIFVKNFRGNACDLHLHEMLEPERSEFDFIREDERFQQIVARLKLHAELPDDCLEQSRTNKILYGFPIG